MAILRLEMALIQFHNGLDLLSVVHESMAEHPEKQEDYANSVYGVYDYLRSIESNMFELLDTIRRER